MTFRMDTAARIGPYDTTVAPDFVRDLAAATGDDNRLYADGDAAPPTSLATRIFAGQWEGMSRLLPPGLLDSADGGVHGEHYLVLHRPVRPGEPLSTYVSAFGGRPAGSNARITFRHSTLDACGEVAADQYWTTMLLGATCEAAGEEPPGHAFPESARSDPAGEHVVALDSSMAHRYASLSGDWSDHHFSVEAARRSGASGVFIHGLCALALCAQGAVRLVAGGDPRRVRRVAVRFASPALLDHDLHIRLYRAGADTYAFEAECAGVLVIRNGLVAVEGPGAGAGLQAGDAPRTAPASSTSTPRSIL